MTTLKLDTLSARIQAHKMALVHIVKPPVCTERAQRYTAAYQQHLDKPIPVRRALALAHHGGADYLDQTRRADRRQPNKRSPRRADLPEYTVSWIEKRSMIWPIVRGPVLPSAKRTSRCCTRSARGGVDRPFRIAATGCLPMNKSAAGHRHY